VVEGVGTPVQVTDIDLTQLAYHLYGTAESRRYDLGGLQRAAQRRAERGRRQASPAQPGGERGGQVSSLFLAAGVAPYNAESGTGSGSVIGA
jgi:hypothetical protein